MKFSERTREVLAYRREQRTMRAAGWLHHGEPVWQIIRGASWDLKIVDAKPDISGKGIWIKLDGKLVT